MSADPEGHRGRGRRGAGPGFCGGPGGGGPGGGRYRRSVLEVAILSSLAESTSHGYNLVDQIETLTADLVCIDPGSMYRLLRAMEEEGLVSSSWQTPETGPSRRVYTISEQGIEALELMARSLSQRAASMQQLADHAVEAVARSRAAGLADNGGSPEQ
jgi:PadR family transcriptional regulator, regulatory protein PadR